ncbi:MAG: stalk domain-containing protein, partial [Lachnospiraceae bacterium]|nr:stalk domain-containing protein [Lachnospiraceae bacterium]
MKKLKALVVLFIIWTIFSSTIAFGAERPTADQFPDKTIIIGTHAIVLDALTQELLSVATQSAKDSNQNKIFFKSDINKGTWYDISDSDSVLQISVTKENIVTNTEINAVPLTHYTKATGETVDLTTGKTVAVSDFSDFSDPSKFPEMAEVVKQKGIQNALKENITGDKDEKKQKKELYESKLSSIDRALAKIADNRVEEYTKTIKSMESMIGSMQKDGKTSSESIAAAVEQKMNVEKERKALCYQLEIDRLNEETTKLDYEKCKDLIDTYATAITNMQGTLAETGASNTAEGDENNNDSNKTVNPLDAMEKQYAKAMQEAAMKNDASAMKQATEDIAVIKNLKSGNENISNEEKKKQLAILQQAKEMAMSSVRESINNANNSEELKNSKSDNSSQAALEKIREDIAQNVADALSNLVSIDERIVDRLETAKEKDAVLASTEAIFTDAVNTIGVELKEPLSNAISSRLTEVQNKRNEVKLSANKEYQQLKKQVEDSKKELAKVYEDYMAAVEKGEMTKASKLKEQLNKGAEVKTQNEGKMQSIAEGVKNGSIAVDLSDTSNTSDGSDNSHSSKENEDTDKKSDDKPSENNGQEQQPEEDPTAQLTSSMKKLAQEQAGKYTQNEKNSLNSAVKSLNNGNSGKTFLPPWNLIFTDYNVKLSVPVMVSGKEVYVPAEELGKMLEAQVIKSHTSNSVVIRGNRGLIEYIPNKTEVYINDKKTNVKPAPYIVYGNKVYLPLSCFEKAFNLTSSTEETYTIVSK